ncbi:MULTISPECIES: TPM domain-containing protein [unclassified Lactobacillus]|uniref:TPM domain-containing protein n=1 Tax=unclassified Lactobacillus TaxID=2620435 RepID=UPI00223F548B|nr:MULTISPECIES: TPM domain-containing protein [unclassified Lactobacillus]
MLKKLLGIFVVGISFLTLSTTTVYADNKDVQDNAHVLSAKTQDYIKKINDNDLSKIKGHPQIAVVTQKSLNGKDLDELGQQIFDKYKFGNRDYDNGVLLLLITKDHRFRMQTGYGVEPVLPDSYVNELVAGKIKSDLKKEDYNSAVSAMVNKTAQHIAENEDELPDKDEIANHTNESSKESNESSSIIDKIAGVMIGILKIINFIFKYGVFIIIGVGIVGIALFFFISARMDKKLHQAIKAAGITSPKEEKAIYKFASNHLISARNIPALLKIQEYNRKIPGKKIPLSNNFLEKVEKMSLTEYQTLITHYNEAIEVAEKTERPKNFPRNYYRRFVKDGVIIAALTQLLSDDFDPEALGQKWSKQAKDKFHEEQEERKRAREERQRRERERRYESGSSSLSHWYSSDSSSYDSSSSNDDFGGDGGSSGGGGGDSSW